MKTIRCDSCGTKKEVKEAFVTVWNGNVADLCYKCAKPLIKILDDLCGGKTWIRQR